MRGKFITVEGPEGAGKSTNMSFMRDLLEAQGHQVVMTREPGGTDIAEQIRGVLLDKDNKGLCSDTELLLMFAARAQHLNELILPSLEQGKWVICDRFTDATYAYQGGGRGLSLERVSQLETYVQGEFRPDATLLFDLPVEVGMQRARNRGAADRFEQEQMDFFERVRACYLERSEQEPNRFHLIDAQVELSAVQDQVKQVIEQLLG